MRILLNGRPWIDSYLDCLKKQYGCGRILCEDHSWWLRQDMKEYFKKKKTVCRVRQLVDTSCKGC